MLSCIFTRTTSISSVLRAVPGKDMPLSHGKGKNQSFKSKTIERVQERMILQAFTPKALTQADSGEVNCFEDCVDSEGGDSGER